jgi:hypothetical protein
MILRRVVLCEKHFLPRGENGNYSGRVRENLTEIGIGKSRAETLRT